MEDKYPAIKELLVTENYKNEVPVEFLAVEDDRVMGVWISVNELT